jgi:hypothetical protein
MRYEPTAYDLGITDNPEADTDPEIKAEIEAFQPHAGHGLPAEVGNIIGQWARQENARDADPVIGCDELGEYHPSDDPLTDPVNRQIFEEDTDRRLAQRDLAYTSLMDAAASMRDPASRPGLYELDARLDGGHLAAARQVIADARPGVELEAGS